MAASNKYISQAYREGVVGIVEDDDVVFGTSSASTAFVELRIMTVDGSSVATNITRFDVLKALEVFEKAIRDDTSNLGFA